MPGSYARPKGLRARGRRSREECEFSADLLVEDQDQRGRSVSCKKSAPLRKPNAGLEVTVMQPKAATVSITRHLDLRPSFGAAGKKSPTAGGPWGCHPYRGTRKACRHRRGRGDAAVDLM